MSKLEEAIRRAGVQHEIARKKGREKRFEQTDLEQIEDSQNQFLPVRYRIKPSLRHEPDIEHLAQNRIIHKGYEQFALTRYKMLRTRLLQAFKANDWSTLAVTSPREGDGKTLTIINLAISLASQAGSSVFLLDLDLRNPSIADYFGMPDDIPGINAYLEDNASIADVMWDVGVENLAVLANRTRVSHSSECITSAKMVDLYKALRENPDRPLLLLDLPPVLSADDAIAISPYVDSLLIVAAERETLRSDLADAVDMLRSANVLGVVVNKSREK